jgi:hypothetical protein
VFQKELHNGIPNITVWWLLLKRLHLKAYRPDVNARGFWWQRSHLLRVKQINFRHVIYVATTRLYKAYINVEMI